jgi:anaerobic selenocysteine-containing dehydrogenase
MDEFNRRDFLKITGGITAGIGVGALASASPFRALQQAVEWTQNQFSPAKGSESFIPAVCSFCPSRCPVTLRMIGRRPVKAENRNAGCALSQLIIQSLHHPDRIRTPLKRSGKRGIRPFFAVSWESALNDIGSRLGTLISKDTSSSIASICGGSFSQTDILLESILLSAGTAHIYREPTLETLSAKPLSAVTEKNGVVQYDLEAADMLLCFGTDIFGGGFTAPDAANRFFKKLVSDKIPFIYIGSSKNRTASLASEFIPVKPGTESAAALGLILAMTERSPAKADPSNGSDLRKFFSEKLSKKDIETITGVSYDRLSSAASAFVRAKSPVSVAGLGGADCSASAALLSASLVLNGMAGAFGKTVFSKDGVLSRTRKESFNGLDAFIKESHDISMIFMHNANPVHKSPFGKLFADKCASAEMIVSFSPFFNDTDAYADYVLPAVYPIESAFAAMELAAPGKNLIHPCDALIRIAKTAGLGTPIDSAKEAERIYAPRKGTPSFQKAPIEIFAEECDRLRASASKSLNYPLTMIPLELSSVGDGSLMVYPYEEKNQPEYSIHKDELSVYMNPATAKKLGLHNGSSVEIQSERGTLESLRIMISGAYPPDTIAVPVGFGHDGMTRFADGKGVNMKRIASADIDPLTGFARWAATPVKCS